MTENLLDIDSDETIRFSVSEAQELGEMALVKAGFTVESGRFFEAGIEHVWMGTGLRGAG